MMPRKDKALSIDFFLLTAYLLISVMFFSCTNSKNLHNNNSYNTSDLDKKKSHILNIIECSFKNRFGNIKKEKLEKYLYVNNKLLNEIITEDTLLILTSVSPMGGFAISETIVGSNLSRDSGVILINNFNLIDTDITTTKESDWMFVNKQKKRLSDYFILPQNKYYIELKNDREILTSEIGNFINCLIIYKTETQNGYRFFSYANFILN